MARKTKQQALETRNHIIDAAISRFSEHGVSKTTLAEIATTAGVTRGAIYWHFSNKTDLLNEILAQSESGLIALELEYQSKYPNDPLSILREMLIAVLTATATDPKRRALMEIIFHKCEFVGEMSTLQRMQQALNLECYEKIETVLQRCVDAGQLPSGLDVSIAAVVLRGFMTGIMENWLFMPDRFDLVMKAPKLIDTLLDSLVSTSLLTAPQS
ncbi:MAG: HTH-type transcriptional regulator AcrR [Candidatus Erwinia impunctatus]|nr:HTH-type transcriptional regulator AcrR [Culicoides impunctatus]